MLYLIYPQGLFEGKKRPAIVTDGRARIIAKELSVYQEYLPPT